MPTKPPAEAARQRAIPIRLIRAAVLAATLGVLLMVGPGASAHALRIASQPDPGQNLSTSPSQIEITFGETPDRANSFIEVLGTSGRIWAKGAPSLVPGQPPTVVAIRVPTPLPKGVYTVNWKTISSVDGHLATGAFSFGVRTAVTGASSSGATVASPKPSAAAVTSRFVYLGGLIGLLGLVFTELVTMAGVRAPGRVRHALTLSWLLAAGGAAGIAEAQRSAAGIPAGKLLASSIGHALVLREVPLVVAGLALVALWLTRPGRSVRTALSTRDTEGRLILGLVGLATLASMLADVFKSHADAASSWLWFRIGTQWIHFAAAGIWIGGLAGLLLCLGPLGRGQRGGPARRFSFWAGACILVVGVTGTLRALDEVGSWQGLFHTGFGQVVVVKIVLFGALGGLGALNRYRHVGSVDISARNLRRTGGAELVAMAGILVATSILQNLAPSRTTLASAASPAPSLAPIVARATDFAHTYRMTLTISPGTAGFDSFGLALDRYSTGRPVRVTSVSIGFEYPDNPAVGGSDLSLTRQPDGTYAARGANMSLLGQWNLTITIENGTQGSVDVPVDVVTASPPHPIKVQTFAGSPTTYTVALGAGDSLQVYVDPINLGIAEFHATFFGAGGQELPMQTTLAVNEAPYPDGAIGSPFTYRDLDGIGHFVADARVPAGTYRFNVVGTTVTGTALGATLVAPVTR